MIGRNGAKADADARFDRGSSFRTAKNQLRGVELKCRGFIILQANAALVTDRPAQIAMMTRNANTNDCSMEARIAAAVFESTSGGTVSAASLISFD